MKKLFTALFIVGCFSLWSQSEKEAQFIKEKFNVAYELRILQNPVSVKNLFQKDDQLTENYFQYVTSQTPSWYLHYFSRNAMQRYGWRNHWELYQERFLVWADWLQNPFRWNTRFDWNKPQKLFNFLTPAISPIEAYSASFFAENWYIQQRIDQLKGGDILEETYGSDRIQADVTVKKIAATSQNVTGLIRELKNRSVAVETHNRRDFVPLNLRPVYKQNVREMARKMAIGNQSPSSRDYGSDPSQYGGSRAYSPGVNRSPVRTVVRDVSTTSMGNNGSATAASATREQ